MELTCPVCNATFEKKNYQQRYCSNACKVAWRTLSGVKRVSHEERACATCSKMIVTRQPNQQFCSDRCRNEHRRVALRMAPLPERTCAHCSAAFIPKQKVQKYCQQQCESNARSKRSAERARDRAAAARAGRVCADCPVSIAHRMRSALRCESCSVAFSNKQYAAKQKEKRVEASAPKPTRKVPPRRDAPKQGPVKEKPEKPALPNFDGDWFPGWDGCWSPSISLEGRALIEKHYGPAPTTNPLKKTA